MKHIVPVGTLVLMLICLYQTPTFGQFSFIEEPYDMLEVSFAKEKEEIDPRVSFFNVLKVHNPTNRRLRFEVNIGIPMSWTLMGEQTQSVILVPNETKLIPIRVAANTNTIGDVGYTIVASLKDNTGKVFKNSYSFVNVPKRSDIRYKILERNVYIDPTLKNSKISLHFSNKGNVSELIYVRLHLPQTLIMEGSRDGFFKEDFMLAANRDTMISYKISLGNTIEAQEQRNHGISIEAGNRDTTFTSTLWVRSLDSKYTLEIPTSDRILIAELALLNLFHENPPTYEGAIWGTVHGKRGLMIEYFFRTMGEQFYKRNPYIYNYLFFKTQYKRWNILLGDLAHTGMLTLTGKGVQLSYTAKRILANATVAKNFISNNIGVGLSLHSKLTDNLSLITGYNQLDNLHHYATKMPNVGIQFRFKQNYSFNINLGYSLTDYYTQNRRQNGFGAEILSQISFSKLKWNTRMLLGDSKFSGMQRGKTDINSYFEYQISNTQGVIGQYIGINQALIESNSAALNTDQLNTIHNVNILYYKRTNDNLTVSIGPWHNYLGSNSFYLFNPAHWFSAHTSMANIEFRYMGKNSPINVGTQIRGGVSYVTNYSPEFGGLTINGIDRYGRSYMNLYTSIYTRLRNWNLNASYYHGPYTMSEHYARFYNKINSKTVRVICGYSKLLFDKVLELSLRGSYAYVVVTKTNRIGLNGEIMATPGKGWTITFSSTLGHQSTFDDLTEAKYKYNNLYFEFRLRKEFGFHQPQFKYLNLDLYFFKDLNGNGLRDKDEPGIDNVLVSIDKDYELSDSLLGTDRKGEFFAMDFLSDLYGKVTYKNIPEGYYTITFSPVSNNVGNYVSESSQIKAYLNKSEVIEIPFLEKNKIFGQILMHRSKLSNLGTIDISNIKVTATDASGKIYSTLTDKNGKFVIYVPNVEKYTVSLNNIFREHFELEQNTFEVQLNGYKQFELSFIFTEKQRRINFAQQINLEGQNQQIQVVKRTNIAGTVKDGATFTPIKANIKVVNQETGEIIAETVTEARTGNFFTSFSSGNNYHLDITADDYWFYSEPLMGDQIPTFLNLNRDITLTAITVGSKLTLNNVTFERNSATLDEEAKVELTRLIDVLKSNQGIQLEIVGHCDDVEAIDNITIAEDRAREVMKFITEKGYVNVTYKSMGISDPAVNETTEEARKINRRVEAVVVNK